VPPQEELLLREAVAGICSDFGPAYVHRKVEAGEPPTELWDALASRGYLGVNLPEECGGGGLGIAALSIVAEESLWSPSFATSESVASATAIVAARRLRASFIARTTSGCGRPAEKPTSTVFSSIRPSFARPS
jgi:alkylation response protein AidB-like acyl-CoA dehydrogenase